MSEVSLFKIGILLLFSWQGMDEFDEGAQVVVGIKRELLGSGGDVYWENVRDAQLPWFRAKVVSASPKTMVREMILAVEKPGIGDVKVTAAKPMCRTVEIGSEVVVRTLAKEFRRKPFLLGLEATAIRGCPK